MALYILLWTPPGRVKADLHSGGTSCRHDRSTVCGKFKVVGKKEVRGRVFAQHRCVMLIGSYRSFPCVAPTLLESDDNYFHWPAWGLKYSPDPAASTTNHLGIFVFSHSAVRSRDQSRPSSIFASTLERRWRAATCRATLEVLRNCSCRSNIRISDCETGTYDECPSY
jgi:hypothetical protein